VLSSPALLLVQRGKRHPKAQRSQSEDRPHPHPSATDLCHSEASVREALKASVTTPSPLKRRRDLIERI